MTEDTSTIQNDPLNADVGDKDTIKYPLLQDGTLMRFEIREPKVAPTKDTANLPPEQQQKTLTIPCYTTKDAPGVDGRTINAGFPIFVRLFVSVTDKVSGQDIANRLTPYGLACGVPRGVKVSDIIADPKKHLDGKLFDAKVTVEKAREDKKTGRVYPESNSLKPISAS